MNNAKKQNKRIEREKLKRCLQENWTYQKDGHKKGQKQ